MKILLVTYYWPPCGGPGVQRALKFAKYLPEFGYIPYVITVDEKKASYPIIDESLCNEIPEEVKVFRTDTSEPFGAYSALTKKKEIPHSGFANERNPGMLQKFSRFIRGNFYIPDARKGWNKFAYKKIIELLQTEKFDAFMTTSPPHSTQLIGLKLKKETGLPWIADFRDPWTDIYYYKDMMHTAYARRRDAAIEREVLENADEIIVVSPSVKRILEKKSEKINPLKVHVIPNGYDEMDISEKKYSLSDEFIITYTGTIALNYGIQNFIKVISEVVKQNNFKIKLRFIGNTGNDVRALLADEGIEGNVEYVSYMPHKESVSMLMKSTALLLAIPQIENNEGILTGKLFEYLASKKSIICIGPAHGDAAAIINECQAGQTFNYDNKIELKNFISSLLEKWKKGLPLENDKNIFQKYSRRNQTSELCSIMNALIGGKAKN